MNSATAILARFGLNASACALAPLEGAGGFSGAKLWKVACGERLLCLRRWPANYPDETRLRFIHAVMEFAGMQVDFVPRLQRTPGGDTAISDGEHLWELTTWLPGVADFHARPAQQRLTAAMHALARLHSALEYFPTRMTGAAPSPGIAERRQRLAELQNSLPALISRLPAAQAYLHHRGERIVAYFRSHQHQISDRLAAANSLRVPLQPCLRDIWHDHVLYSGEEVTGIVDFDAVRIDSVATDLARLIGSLVGGDVAARKAALSAYMAVRPLSADEVALISVFDASSVLMSGMNWLVWLLIDARQFPNPAAVAARLDEVIRRFDDPLGTPPWQPA